MIEVVREFAGRNMSARVVKARGVEGKLGEFEVMYEYSRKNGVFLFHIYNGARKTFANVALANAAAKRIVW